MFILKPYCSLTVYVVFIELEDYIFSDSSVLLFSKVPMFILKPYCSLTV